MPDGNCSHDILTDNDNDVAGQTDCSYFALDPSTMVF